jgi:acid stress-induced BolA-like protein IbaG/YrbA
MVYRTLGERVGREIHALSIEALTPEEAGGTRRPA